MTTFTLRDAAKRLRERAAEWFTGRFAVEAAEAMNCARIIEEMAEESERAKRPAVGDLVWLLPTEGHPPVRIQIAYVDDDGFLGREGTYAAAWRFWSEEGAKWKKCSVGACPECGSVLDDGKCGRCGVRT